MSGFPLTILRSKIALISRHPSFAATTQYFEILASINQHAERASPATPLVRIHSFCVMN
jgi:hypothetical protein